MIEALKAMAERAGWDQDLTGVQPNATVVVLKRRLVTALLDKMVAAMLVPVAWDITTAAFRLGGETIEDGLHSWSLTELDMLAKLFSKKLREAAR